MDSKGRIADRLRRFFLRVGSARMGRAVNALDKERAETLRTHNSLVDQAEFQPSNVEIRRAVAELRRFSDAQLDDIGVARADIERAVVKGRFEVKRPRKVA